MPYHDATIDIDTRGSFWHDDIVVNATLQLLNNPSFPAIRREHLETLQVNMGYRCNQTCHHCHVNAGPGRTEQMDESTVEEVLRFLGSSDVKILDITGGAPELNPYFRRLVTGAIELGRRVIDRCNLTILEEEGQEGLAQFLAENGIEIVSSLPCYLEENVDRQRGKGVYRKSIKALRLLNILGYGQPDSGLMLNLVYNPLDGYLPPAQQELEADYKRELFERFNIVFNSLYTLANMPIQRFGRLLESRGQFEQYLDLLKSSHRDENLQAVMCRTLISVDWQGYVYDCDFNQMLGLSLQFKDIPRVRISDIIGEDLSGLSIKTADHCYGCTAGQGSGCGGALAQDALAS